MKLTESHNLNGNYEILPCHGSIYLFNKIVDLGKNSGKNWRTDGLNYNARKNNSSIQES